MAEQIKYVRAKLGEASKVRGGIAKIARAVDLDRRTVRAVLNTEHSPNVATVDKLVVYFLNEARRGK